MWMLFVVPMGEFINYKVLLVLLLCVNAQLLFPP